MRFYGEITKFEKQDDGSLIVCGIASSEAVDSDGEVIKADAMRAALPDFFKYGTGNLREMHQPIAAGTITHADVNEDGTTYIEANVIDPVAAMKVEKGVYKGFSIGGKVLPGGREGKMITKLKLTEISLVDRPANPEAVFTMFKAEEANVMMTKEEAVESLADMLNKGEVDPVALLDELTKRKFSEKERKKDAEAGVAMPDGSFPIANKQDLKNAIQAYGRAKDKAAAKKHIIERAKALNAEDEIPAEWMQDEKEKSEAIADLKKYAGEEIGDSAAAIQALSTIYYLLIKESEENEDEPGQVADLAAAVAHIKSFIASEIQEENSQSVEMAMSDKPADVKKSHDAEADAKPAVQKDEDVEDMSVPEMVEALHHGADDDEMGMLSDAMDSFNASEDLTKGDYPGHPFRGNQYVGGSGSTNSSKASRHAHESSKATLGKGSSRASHNTASAAHQKAANAAKKEGRSHTANYHQKMADYHASRANRFKKSDESSDIRKLLDIDEAITKVVSPLQEKIAELQEKLNKMPAVPKGVLRAVDKSEDSIMSQPEENIEVHKADGTIDQEATALQLIKKVHSSGGRPLGR